MYADDGIIILSSLLTTVHQILLRLSEHADADDDDLYNLYHRVCGVIFLGCVYAECSPKSGDRVTWSLKTESKEQPPRPVAAWFESLIENFKKVKLPIHEPCTHVPTTVFGGSIKSSDIVRIA
jgi:hypothetical protein